MRDDYSEGYDDIAEAFMAARSNVGAELVRAWARGTLPEQATILDIGCGSGVPISEALIKEGFEVHGIDASPKLVAAFQQRFPKSPIACEAAQTSTFFAHTFEAAVAIGLIFLLSEEDQRAVIQRIADALNPGGHFLFSAPTESGEWEDVLTGRKSRSLGETRYISLLQHAGLRFNACLKDENGNNYYAAMKST